MYCFQNQDANALFQVSMEIGGLQKHRNRCCQPRSTLMCECMETAVAFRSFCMNLSGHKPLLPVAVYVYSGVRYETFVIGSDEDMQVLFHCRRSFPEVRIPELFAKLKDGVDSSGASALNPQSTTIGGASTSMSVVAAAVLIPEPERAGAVHTSVPPVVPDFEFEVGPDRVENALRDDDSDEEPVDIGGDNDDDIPRGTCTAHGGSGSGTQEYPPHLSSLNLEAIGQHQNIETTFVGQGMHDGNPLMEFQIGQSFQSKEEAMLIVDASVSIKVLQEATEATYGFRPSYRKVWLAKQKAVTHIYGDWEESYGDLPRWILGIKSTMDGSVALLNLNLSWNHVKCTVICLTLFGGGSSPNRS
ncbi:uncharacterized protein LOC130956585 [Arachis stenosperma]|uniref:uncharacterized protein LOC130956585 n=1 Tax=Arachis stenosperma TaxID=217475 RepID=UPI0025AC899B|nr:uncharacterized protein LOC130956585 [Arachis stenosperma]